MNLPKGEGAVSGISFKKGRKAGAEGFLAQLLEEQVVGRGIRTLPNCHEGEKR
jgi:hypothetical protein